MAQKDLLTKEKMGHSGLFDFGGFYNYAHRWLKEEGYGVIEERYSEKISGEARDISIEWKASKDMTEYFKKEMQIRIDIKGLVEVEVEIDGKRKKMNKGSVDMEIKGFLIRDPKSVWDGVPLYRFLRDLYNKYIIPGKIDSMEEDLKNDVTTFKDQDKAFLELIGKR